MSPLGVDRFANYNKHMFKHTVIAFDCVLCFNSRTPINAKTSRIVEILNRSNLCYCKSTVQTHD